MKVRRNLGKHDLVKSNVKIKKNKLRKTNIGKIKVVLSDDQSVLKLKCKGKKKSKTEKGVSLIVNMDTHVHTSVPSLIETIENQSAIDNRKGYNVQQLSDLVSPINLKSNNSKIGRLPCNYKLAKKKKLMEKVQTNLKPLTENSLEKCLAVDGIEFHVLSASKVMLIMTAPMLLYFNGSLKIKVLMGCVEVLGYTIDSKDTEQTLYSTKGNSHMCLKAVAQFFSDEKCFSKEKNTVEKLLEFEMKTDSIKYIFSKLTENSVVVIVQRNKDSIYSEIWPKFLFKHCSSYSIIPKESKNFFDDKSRPFSVVENVLNSLFELSSSNVTPKEFKEMPEWSKIENEIILQRNDLPAKAVLIGGKGVGKSTLLRFLVNKSLKKWKQVLVLDFDIGQSEFTVPGCVSAILVDKPLLGPNFTHLMDPIRSVFVGDIDAVRCLPTYMKSFQQVLNFCKEEPTLQEIPWFINTMGFVKALGLKITSAIIQQTSPTHVVQIYTRDKSRNFDIQLKSHMVNKIDFGHYTKQFEKLDYKLFYIPSAAQKKEEKNICSKEWGMPAPQSRQVVLFAYLSKMLTPPSLNLLELTPYVVSISKIYFEVHVTVESQKQALAAMNGNLVALCSKDLNKQELPNCLGFGIVRGIDYPNDNLFLITPLELEKLQQVNCLIKGNISLPDSFYLEPEGSVEGQVPYVSYTSERPITQPIKNEFKPIKMEAGTHIKGY